MADTTITQIPSVVSEFSVHSTIDNSSPNKPSSESKTTESKISEPKASESKTPVEISTEIKEVNPEIKFGLEDEEDNGSVLVIILQCETKACDQNITNLKWLFSDPYFIVQVCAVDAPMIPNTKTLTLAQYRENYYMRKALNYAAEGPYLPNSNQIQEPQYWWNTLPIIIVKDSSVSNITPMSREDNAIGGMKRRIKIALEKANQADLFFLCKWNDACNKYTEVEKGANIEHGSSLKWSMQPTATQAIMYTPSARDHVRDALMTTPLPLSNFLNINIAKGQLLATVFVPNIIDFDIDLATSNEDYAKLNECAPATGTTGTVNNTALFIWFAIIIVAIILVAWALIQLNPNTATIPT